MKHNNHSGNFYTVKIIDEHVKRDNGWANTWVSDKRLGTMDKWHMSRYDGWGVRECDEQYVQQASKINKYSEMNTLEQEGEEKIDQKSLYIINILK